MALTAFGHLSPLRRHTKPHLLILALAARDRVPHQALCLEPASPSACVGYAKHRDLEERPLVAKSALTDGGPLWALIIPNLLNLMRD